ncbi:hypothetical protein E1301_Tti022393 [Triplophysa tibetana]|uniref:Uncharacterized protein n=1 Tax=Triplophysa tibetana TaxID=1572043 RepID=A0A5A9NNW0_9TELE|nr:hypothetical protein E1301_Tti022393 [Triplophysa tibetana]
MQLRGCRTRHKEDERGCEKHREGEENSLNCAVGTGQDAPLIDQPAMEWLGTGPKVKQPNEVEYYFSRVLEEKSPCPNSQRVPGERQTSLIVCCQLGDEKVSKQTKLHFSCRNV